MMARCRMACMGALAACLSAGLLHAAPKRHPQTHEGTHAHQKHHAHEDGAEDVKDVLLREQVKPLDRRAELHPLLNRRPDFAPARWHSGYVDVAGSWQSYTSLADPKALELLEQYRDKRTALDGSVRSQLQLAHWCHEHGLRDQERAHLSAALADAAPADRPAIYQRLGYHEFGSQWLSPGEVAELTAIGQQAEASLKHWGPILERVANQIEGNPHHQRAALKMLGDIGDPAAIPAIESALMNLSETGARTAIETIGRIDAYEASQSLARAAVFANSDGVRSEAIAALKSRRMDDYVPSVIDLLSTDVQPGFQLMNVNRGAVFYTWLLVREKADQVDVRATTVIHPGIAMIHLHYRIKAKRLEVSPLPNVRIRPEVALGIQRNALDEAYRRDRQIRQENDAIEQLNHRAINVLAAVSGQTPTSKPQDWWAWWDRESDRQLIRGKTVVRVDEFAASSTPMASIVFSKGSCFVAGTPVWTETGPVPIEKLQIGDRVLAQNIETGELAYKPVLQATVRPPKELVRMTAGGEELVCTGGHRFWASGQGWMKARDLTPAQLVRTATGTVRVESASRADVDKTHNLVVADFHSYFVGQQAFLVQDLPLPRSTNCVVPGLQPEWK